MIDAIDILEAVPQTEEFLFHLAVLGLDILFAVLVIRISLDHAPQAGIGIGVKKGGEQVVTEDFADLLFYLGR